MLRLFAMPRLLLTLTLLLSFSTGAFAQDGKAQHLTPHRTSASPFGVHEPFPSDAVPRSAPDTSGIRQVALDYVEGWYDRDQDRMRRALHPELEKRIVWRTGDDDELGQQSARTLILSTGRGDARLSADQRTLDVRILDVYRHVAVVRVDSNEYVDYLQVARWNGAWKIINILWDVQPGVVPGQLDNAR